MPGEDASLILLCTTGSCTQGLATVCRSSPRSGSTRLPAGPGLTAGMDESGGEVSWRRSCPTTGPPGATGCASLAAAAGAEAILTAEKARLAGPGETLPA